MSNYKRCYKCTASYTGECCPFKCSAKLSKPSQKQRGLDKELRHRERSKQGIGKYLTRKESREAIKKIFGDDS